MATVQEDTGQQTADDDQALVRAIGRELQRARVSVGWSRPELVSRMRSQVPVNTYACYEQGIRQCSIPRLYEICQALDVDVLELLALALQRVERDLEKTGVRIDLRKILEDTRDELKLLRQWAQNKIKEDAPTTDSRKSAVVRLPWVAIREVAVFCGIPQNSLSGYIREFTPESALDA